MTDAAGSAPPPLDAVADAGAAGRGEKRTLEQAFPEASHAHAIPQQARLGRGTGGSA